MKRILAKVVGLLYYVTIQQVWNILANCWWMIKIWRSGRYQILRACMRGTARHLVYEQHIQTEYGKFRYKYDGIFPDGTVGILGMFPTWEPWPIVLFFRSLQGNCDDAVVFAKWLYKQWAKNSAFDAKGIKVRRKLMVPCDTFKNMFMGVHFIAVATRPDALPMIYSSGRVLNSQLDAYAEQYLGTKNFVWVL